MSDSLPPGWALSTLGEVRVDRGSSVSPADHPEELFELYSVPSHPSGSPEVLQGREIGSNKQFVSPDTVLLCKINPRINRVWIVGPATRHAQIASTEWIPFFDVPGIRPRYLAWFMHQEQFRNFLASNVSGVGGSLMRVKASTFGGYPFPVAPSAEQLRIVDEIERHVTRIDEAIADAKRAQAHLTRYRASVLKAACEGRLVPTEADLSRAEGRDFESGSQLLERIMSQRTATRRSSFAAAQPELKDTVDLPEGWCWASIDMVGDILLGRQRAPQYLKGIAPRHYLRVANIKDDRIDFSDLEEMDFDDTHFMKYQLATGDILVCEGQSPELLGQSAIFRGERDGLCFQKTLHRFRPLPTGPPPEYAQIVFRSHVKSGVFRRFGSITTNIGHLTLEKFKSVPFPLPPLAEQSRIVAEVERLMSFADVLAATIDSALARAARLRQSILKRAFEGKLVPRDPNDEPASVLLERIRKKREAAAGAANRSAKQRARPGTRTKRASSS